MRLLLPLLGLKRLCGLFGMTRQAYYERSWREDDVRMLEHEVLQLVAEQRARGRFGVRTLLRMMGPRMEELGIQIGRDRLYELLRGHGLLVRPRRRHAVTTNSRHKYEKWPYLLGGGEVDGPERAWVSDITYIRTVGGFLYLFLVTDVHSRQVMGHHLGATLEAKGAVAALRMAIGRRSHPDKPLIHHSDRGVQYCSANYVDVLVEAGITISMTEGASPHQNSIAERINRTFKEQLYMDQVFSSHEQAQQRLDVAVETYNNSRPHRSCSNMTPALAHSTAAPLTRDWKSNKARRQQHVEALGALHTSSQVCCYGGPTPCKAWKGRQDIPAKPSQDVLWKCQLPSGLL